MIYTKRNRKDKREDEEVGAMLKVAVCDDDEVFCGELTGRLAASRPLRPSLDGDLSVPGGL